MSHPHLPEPLPCVPLIGSPGNLLKPHSFFIGINNLASAWELQSTSSTDHNKGMCPRSCHVPWLYPWPPEACLGPLQDLCIINFSISIPLWSLVDPVAHLPTRWGSFYQMFTQQSHNTSSYTLAAASSCLLSLV